MEIIKQVISLLVGLVVFVTGMNFMSSGLKTCAGRSIRRLFKRIRDNRLASAGIGAGTTAIIQSSGATTVMVIGFLSAGALTFAQGLSIMLGAFVGTTVTGLLVALSSFSFSVFLMLTAFIGFILGFFKSENAKSIGEILVGFGILFFGREAMKGAFANPDIQAVIVDILQVISFPPLLMLAGAVLTVLTQSSSATNGIVIVMVASNPNLLASGFYLVLGATIGAMMPAYLAALKSSILAKRVTYSAIALRVFGAVLGTLLVWALQNPLMAALSNVPTDDVGVVLAVFTIIYNLIFLFALLPLLTPIEKTAVRLIKDREDEEKRKALRHIDRNLLNTPSIAVLQVQKEIETMLDMAKANLFLGLDAVLTGDLSGEKELEAREEEIDYFNTAIADYLIELSPKANLQDEARIAAYYHVINDVERIGDHAVNFMDMAKQMSSEDLAFSEKAKSEFRFYGSILDEMFGLAADIFMDRKPEELGHLHELEEETDRLKLEYSANHFDRLRRNECVNALSPYHSSLLTELERIADHLTNIGYSIENPTGDEVRHSG